MKNYYVTVVKVSGALSKELRPKKIMEGSVYPDQSRDNFFSNSFAERVSSCLPAGRLVLFLR